MKCFLDIDGVLTDFPTAMNRYLGTSVPPDQFGDVNLPNALGMTIPELDTKLDAPFWENLPWLPTGRTVLELVEDYFGRDNICLFSFPSYNSEGATGKIDWIKKNLPDYSNRFLLGTLKYFCASPTTVLLDDKEKNIREFKHAGGLGVVVPAPWNSLKDKDVIAYLYEQLSIMIPGIQL
ncbi:MAG: hypothetical protein IMZ52_08830 [Actinobacteria bacterium]|nr:hypothetical protein [Actinomycetota bacterium]